MKKRDRYILVKSNNLRAYIVYPITFVGLIIVLYNIKLDIYGSLILLLICGSIMYKIMLNSSNDFYFYSNKIKVNNILRFWSQEKEFYYNDIRKIVIKNLPAAFNDRYIRLHLNNNKKNSFGFFGVDKNRLKKIVKKFAEGGFDIEYYE